MLTAGTDGAGWHGGFDSSVSFRGGYTATYGDLISGSLGSTMGVYGLQIAGGVNSTLDLATKVTGAYGHAIKAGRSLGVIEKPTKGGLGGGNGGATGGVSGGGGVGIQ